jgi:beta-glucosidase
VNHDCKPLFPFGFGLTYTPVGYDHLNVHSLAAASHNDLKVLVDVMNMGGRDGDKVASFTCEKTSAVWSPPSRSLEGFQRIHLKLRRHAILPSIFHKNSLRCGMRKRNGVVDPGSYTVWVNGLSEASLSGQFMLRR